MSEKDCGKGGRVEDVAIRGGGSLLGLLLFQEES